MIADKYLKSNTKLPSLLTEYKCNKKLLDNNIRNMTEKWNKVNNLPDEYSKKLKNYLI